MISPKSEPDFLTFEVPGWDGVAICPSMRSVPFWLARAWIADPYGTTREMADWLPPEIGEGLMQATPEQQGAFFKAWMTASWPELEGGPRQAEPADRKLGMTVAELAAFCEGAKHLADQPVQVRIGWSAQIQRINVGGEG